MAGERPCLSGTWGRLPFPRCLEPWHNQRCYTQRPLPQLVSLLCFRKDLTLSLTFPLATSTPWNQNVLYVSIPLASLSAHSLGWDTPPHILSLLSSLADVYFPSDTSFLTRHPECALPQSGASWRTTHHGLPLALRPQGRPPTPVPLGPHPWCT